MIALQLPADLDRWIHLGTMLGPQYSDEGFDARGPNQFHWSGFLMGDLTLTEIHFKESKQFPPGTERAAPLLLPNDCVSCPTEHGAYDGVFAQFYPALRDKIPSSGHD